VRGHGYIDPETYFPGQGMPREQDYLARKGSVVLRADYRNHAGSDSDDDVDYELRLVHHGSADDTCPIGWSRASVQALEQQGKDVTLRTYRGEGHTFERQWQTSIERTKGFFES
jgi:hypothetical protein